MPRVCPPSHVQEVTCSIEPSQFNTLSLIVAMTTQTASKGRFTHLRPKRQERMRAFEATLSRLEPRVVMATKRSFSYCSTRLSYISGETRSWLRRAKTKPRTLNKTRLENSDRKGAGAF